LSFSLRLTLFFLLIVVVPIFALGILVADVAGDAEVGKTDAALAAGLRTALAIRDEAAAEAQAVARSIGTDPALVDAVESGKSTSAAVARSLQREHGLATLRVQDADEGELVSLGGRPTVAAVTQELIRGGSRIGSLTISTTGAAEYVADVERMTGDEAVLLGPRGLISGTAGTPADAVPAAGEAANVEATGEELRAAAASLGDRMRIALFAPIGDEGFFASRPRVALALAGFLLVALLAALTLTRALRGQVQEMLGAARRIGSGDFSREVPVTGNDELAGLAHEFNKMSDRLSEQMGQLRRQRVEIERSVQRIGGAVASGLDRDALLTIMVETAVGACEAEYGIVAASGRAGAEVEFGQGSEQLRDVALAAEHQALRDGGLAEAQRDGTYAMSSVLGAVGSPDSIGVMTIARTGRAFTLGERDVFVYLLGQAAASVENVALHELVSEQAVTDELTGLSNNRAFRDAIVKEAARARRFGHDLSLLMLDVDDFKQVNDAHGHPQGDAVLRAIGRVLDEESRGIDEPARYGGEEFAVALPETGTAGALEVAERIRSRIEGEPVGRVNGDGELWVTASIGVATLPGDAEDAGDLVAAADAALYAAKRAGKNRVETATPVAEGPRPSRRS
jgi:diguanylate cyclase (GGDEF)-like protein